jgi:hypothetical protein
LPFWTGTAYQGGAELPDAALGWVSWNRRGGHPGRGNEYVAIRRWTAPQAGVLSVTGKVDHKSDKGDGILARLVFCEDNVAWQSTVHHGVEEFRVPRQFVAEGQTLDLVVHCGQEESHDGFECVLHVELNRQDGEPEARTDSRESFRGPIPPPLDAWGQLAQALMLTNEFVMLD